MLWNGLYHYGVVYKSRVFTHEYFTDDNAAIQADYIIMGDTGYGLTNKLPDEVERTRPDYPYIRNLRESPTAFCRVLHKRLRILYSFTKRGAQKRCCD